MSVVLVTGGAGYIGAHAVRALLVEGFQPVVFDNLSSGLKENVKGAELVIGDLRDMDALRRVFALRPVEAVLHFASLIRVGESYLEPRKYYVHNLTSSLNLLEAMLESGVPRIVFSSSAAVYGLPRETPITEDHPLEPINPYGQTKAVVERILRDYDRAYGLRFVSLRYFNAAGAGTGGELGERHDPETHLVPNVLRAIRGRIPVLGVFGTDFPTPDGTAIRDYVHVTDLAAAHVLALRRLFKGGTSEAVNLGTNRGWSVKDVIAAAERVTGRSVPWETRPRREGDVPVLLASKTKAERVLGWSPRFSDLETIVRTAWAWHSRE